MAQSQTASWVKNDYVHKSSVTQRLTHLQWQELAQRRTDVRYSLMYKIVHNLILIEAIKYVQIRRNLINQQHILANKKYYDMSFFSHTVKDSNSLPQKLITFQTSFNKRLIPCMSSRGQWGFVTKVNLIMQKWLNFHCFDMA